jgi:ABC-type transporter MlaC component
MHSPTAWCASTPRASPITALSIPRVGQREESATVAVVSTQITRLATGGQIVLDWSVEKTPESYKVIDLSAGAASLARAQQEEFAFAVQRSGGSVSSLIQRLRTKVTELAMSAH